MIVPEGLCPRDWQCNYMDNNSNKTGNVRMT
jgi:hypothetical protein